MHIAVGNKLIVFIYIAGGGIDYYSGPYKVTFLAGITSVSFNISINDDIVLEDNEEFELIIDSGSLPNSITTGIPNISVVTITDNDSKFTYIFVCIVASVSIFIPYNHTLQSIVHLHDNKLHKLICMYNNLGL